MAKYQICQYKCYQSDNWHRGLAKVKAYGLSDVVHIIDEDGDKIPDVYDYQLLIGYTGTVIDTDIEASFNLTNCD